MQAVDTSSALGSLTRVCYLHHRPIADGVWPTSRFRQSDFWSFTFLDLGPPVPLGASGDEKPPSITVTGDPVGSMPADTHLFQVFFEGASPCLLRPPPVLLTSSGTQYITVYVGLSLCCVRTWPAIFLLLVVTMSVVESLRACSPHHLFICDMFAP